MKTFETGAYSEAKLIMILIHDLIHITILTIHMFL